MSIPGHRSMLRRCAFIAMGVVMALPARAQVSREYDLKAAFLHNLANFVEWPPAAMGLPETPFVIGVLGNDPFGLVLDDAVANEYVGMHPMVVRRFRRSDDFTACHLLFIADSESRRIPEILRAVRGRPILTVGDRPGFVESGGMVGIAIHADHLQLVVNLPAARAAELVLSSKLLEIAQVVETYASSP